MAQRRKKPKILSTPVLFKLEIWGIIIKTLSRETQLINNS
jgi:hypothetical protein